MSYSSKLDSYLGEFRQRLKQLALARGAGAMALAALIVSLVVVWLASRSGFPPELMVVGRLLLAATLVGLAWWLIVARRRHIDAGAANEIEARTPAFGGRVEAYLDTRDPQNPMRELLAEETLGIASDHAPGRQVAPQEFRLAWGSAGVAAAVLLLIAIAGPGNFSFGVRDLWVGWAFPGLLPPQSIEVSPGDDGIRLGGTVRVRARMQGFDPNEAFVHASFGDDDWQQVPMSQAADGWEFTFFSVRQPLEYFVSASNVRSPTYQVAVVDLPNIENLTLTYHYPEWTERDPEVHDPGGDIRAIADTEIELRITTDRPMTPGAIIIDDEPVTLDVDGAAATGTFTLDKDAQYFVAATVGGERIRLTDDYFIRILEDQAPEISFVRPGRDWSASRIEEVTTRVEATDDFKINSLELRYSVNGGDWQSVALDAAATSLEIDHVFFLESLAAGSAGSLVPGDLISYYAVAEDRENAAQTDMFFIDVQPFDRRYSQSQQMGGPGQQGGQQNEVSERQRQIIISTWNLIRERTGQRRDDPAYINDNAALLSRLQETLKGQVETLAQRAEARQLTSSDEDIAQFVEHLYAAADAMTPAAELLAEIDLEQALSPEQEALQHLLAAEAVFTDINVSLQANNRGGRGGQAGRDLSEMFELEMDLEKNQYETGSSASPNPPQQEMEDAADELAELARRQEQLARNRARVPTPEQRWQQEMLRREVEELQERLEQMANGRQDAGGQSGQQGSQSSESAAQGSSGEDQERELDELRRRLDSAMRAMNDAGQGMRDGADAESLQQAMDEARRQLEGARDSATEASQRAMQAAVSDLAERADDLHDAQAGMERRLQDAVREVMENRDPNRPFSSGMSWDEELRLAEEKRELLSALQELQRDAQNAAQDLEDGQPDVAGELREGVGRLREQEIEARIAVAAAYIEQGEAVYIASSESAITEALRQLRDDIARIEDRVGQAGGLSGEPRPGDRAQQALADARQLRRALAEASEAGNRNSGTQSEQRGGSGPEDRADVSSGVSYEDVDPVSLRRQAEAVADDVTNLLRGLSGAGNDPRDIDELRRLAAGIRARDFSGNPDILAREAREALSLVEQLELRLAAALEGDGGSIRSDVGDEIPEQHRRIVADYYRKLGEVDED